MQNEFEYAGRFKKAQALSAWMLDQRATLEAIADGDLCGDHWDVARESCGQKFPSRETQALALGMIAKGKL